MRHAYPLFVLALLLYSCTSKRSHQAYAFFIAGHVYGSPTDTLPGLHPPFRADWDYLRSIPQLRHGVFTGDIVYHSRPEYWDSVELAVAELERPVYFTPGNHDQGQRSPYRERYGRTYQKFTVEGDLFLLLDPGLGGWNIWREQLDFVRGALAKAERYRNIFVCFHQVLWWTPEGEPASFRNQKYHPNSLDGRTPRINFWPEIVPLLVATQRPVYLFAGDVGANQRTQALSYTRYQNLHLIASGMGNSARDNYLIVGVDQAKKVVLAVRWLQGRRTESLLPEP
ncbi:MAG: metallophosphoesterase [Bacteroidota bacterium]